jgi:hypothetical protein
MELNYLVHGLDYLFDCIEGVSEDFIKNCIPYEYHIAIGINGLIVVTFNIGERDV